MTTIDERIVKMKFDNKQFQEGVKETMQAISQLDTGVKLDNIAGALDHLESKFSTLGVIAMTAIGKLTSMAIDKGKEIVNAFLEPLLEGGKKRALNIEQAKFMFKGLGIDETEALENARQSVLGTAYGLDVAAKAAAMLSASGQELGDDMEHALTAIAGTASMANVSFEDMSNIFTTIASNGKLMTMQLRQFSFKGLNMAAILAGELGVSEQKIQEMVTKGQVTWEMFYKALFNKFGDFAKMANQTYEGAIKNYKAAWARVGVDFFTYSHDAKREVYNTARYFVDNINKALSPIKLIYKDWVENTAKMQISFMENFNFENVNEIGRILANFMSIILSVKKAAQQAWVEIFPPKAEKQANALLSAFRRLTVQLKPGYKQFHQIKRVFKGLFSVVGLVGDVFKTVFTIIRTLVAPIFGALGKSTQTLGGGFLEMIALIGDFLVKIREWVQESKLLEYITKGVGIAVDFVVKYIRKFVNLIKDSKIYKTFTKNIQAAYSAFKEWLYRLSLTDIYQKVANGVKNISSKFQEWFATLKNTTIYKKTRSGIQSIIEKTKEWYQHLREKDTWVRFWDRVKTTFSKIKDRFNDFIKSPTMQSVISKTKEVFWNIVDNLKIKYGEIRDMIVKFFKDIRDETGKIDFNKVKEKFIGFITSLIEKIKKFRGDVKQSVGNILGDIGSVFSTATKTAGTIGEKFGAAFKVLSDRLKHISITDLTGLIKAIAGLKLVDLIKRFIVSPFEKITGSIKDIFDAVKDAISTFMGAINSYIKAKAFTERSKAILNFAIAIGIMAASLYILAKLPSNELEQGALALSILSGAMIGLFIALQFLDKVKMPSAKGHNPLMEIAIAIGVLVGSLYALTKLNLEGIEERLMLLIGVTAVFVILALFLSGGSTSGLGKAFSKIPKGATLNIKNASSSISGLIGFAVAVLILIKAIEKMTKVDITGYEDRIIKIMSVIGGFMLMTKLAGENAAKGAVALFAISITIGILVLVIKLIGTINDRDLARGMFIIGTFMLFLSAFMMSTALAGEHAKKAAAAILNVGITIALLTGSMYIISKMDPKMIVPATLIIAGLMTMLMAVIVVSGTAKDAHKTLTAVAVVMAILAGLVIAMSFIDPSLLLPAALALNMTIGMMALLIKAAGDANKAEPTMAALVFLIAGMAGIIILLVEVTDANQALIVATALSEILLAASAAAYIAQKIDPKAAMKGAAGIDAVIAIVGALFLLLGMLDDLLGGRTKDWIEKGIDLATTICRGIGEMVGAIIGGIGEGITNSLPKIADNISSFGEKIQPFLKVIENIKPNFGENVGALALGIIALIGGNLLDTITGWLSGGKKNLTTLGEDLAGMAPNIKKFATAITGIKSDELQAASAVMSSFAQIIDSMPSSGGVASTIFGEKQTLEDFSNGIIHLAMGIMNFQLTIRAGGGIDQAIVESATATAETFASLEANLPAHGGIIKGWFSGDADLKTFGQSMVYFAYAIVAFQKTLNEGLPGGKVDLVLVMSARMAGEIMSDLDKNLNPHPKGLKWLVSSDNNLKDFGEHMAYFAAGFVAFYKQLLQIPGGQIDQILILSVRLASEMMAELDKNLNPHPKGLKWLVSSDNNLKDFGEHMAYFAIGFVAFYKQLLQIPGGQIDNRLVASVGAAGMAMAALDKSLPAHGGVVHAWTGDNSLSVFGAELVVFGACMAAFYLEVQNLNVAKIDEAAVAAQALVNVANTLEGSSGGLKSIWSHEYNFADLGKELVSLGNGLGQFADSVGGEFKAQLIHDVVPTIKELVEIAKGMGSIPQSAMTLFTADLKRVGEGGVTGFTEAFTGAEKKIKEAMNSMLSTAVTEAENKQSELSAAIYKTIDKSLKEIGNAFENYKPTAKSKVRELLSAITAEFSTKYLIFKSHGTNLVTNFYDGIKSKNDDIRTVFIANINYIREELKRNYQKYYDAAKYLVDGFVKGIEDNTPKAETAGKNLGVKTHKATQKGLQESSPSRLYYKSGELAVLGLVNALKDGGKTAEEAGEDLAFASALGVVTALALIQSIMNDEIGEPTIRPILDLSDVRNSAGELDRLMKGKTYSSKLAYSASNDIRDQQSYVGSTGFARLESAIKGIGGVGNTTYDINIKVEGDSLSTDKIKEIAATVEQEIKHINDRIVFSRGEAVRFV